MKNLLRIFLLLLVVAAVVGVSMFLMGQNDRYNNIIDDPSIASGDKINSGELEEVSGDNELLESGDTNESGDLNEVELVSGEKNKEDNVADESGEKFVSGEVVEVSGEIPSGELAE